MRKTAYKIAYEAFINKKDKAGEPYIGHLQRVALPFKEDETLYTIALLHDLLEDCPEWTLERLARNFPLRVCSAIEALTRGIHGPESYEEFILRLSRNYDAISVKISDLKDNMDLTRLKRHLEPKDIDRTLKYHSAYIFLNLSVSFDKITENEHPTGN